MNPTIKEQQRLMKLALRRLDDIDMVERLIKPIDPVRCKVMCEDIAEQYMNIMSQLQLNFLSFNHAANADL